VAQRMWGRLYADVDVKLRRGAWYKVLRIEGLDAVIEVNRKPRTVLKALLEISTRPPIRWSMVAVPPNRKNAVGTPGERYGVCPSCNERSAIPKRAKRHACPHCKREYEVAWDEKYLG